MARSLRSTPFNIFSNISVSGSTSQGSYAFVSSVTGFSYQDNIGYQVDFVGSTQGVLQVSASINYNPQLPESANMLGSSANGTWFTLASISMANAVSPVGFNLNQVPYSFIRCEFISGTSNGTLTSGFVMSKGLG